MRQLKQIPALADLHCHLIPYVDDGASDMDDSKRLINEEYNQGVRHIVMTAHLRYGYFDTPVYLVGRQFDQLKLWIKENFTDLKVEYSREYYCDDRLLTLLDGYGKNTKEVAYDNKIYCPQNEIIPFGTNKCILLEFSSNRIQKELIIAAVNKTFIAGLTPVIAHVERYPIIQKHPEFIQKCIDAGAYIQVNADSIIGLENKIRCQTARELINMGAVDVVSSDAHDPLIRKPNLLKCYKYLKSKYGAYEADKLMHDNIYYLLEG